MLLRNLGLIGLALLLFGTVFAIALVLASHFENLPPPNPAPRPATGCGLREVPQPSYGGSHLASTGSLVTNRCQGDSPRFDHPWLRLGEKLLGCERLTRWLLVIGQTLVRLAQYQIPLARPI